MRRGRNSSGGKKRPRAPSIDDREVFQWGDESDDDNDDGHGRRNGDSDDVGGGGERVDNEEEERRLGDRRRGEDGDEIENETPQEKRVRLARDMLQRVHEEERSRMAAPKHSDSDEGHYGRDEDEDEDADDHGIFEDGAILRDAVSMRLQKDMMEASGKLQLNVAEKLGEVLRKAADGSEEEMREMRETVGIFKKRGHSKAATSIALSFDDSAAWTGSKDCTICRWDVKAEKKVYVYRREGHTGEVLALAVSSDGKFLASGSRDRTIKIWDTRTNSVAQTFRGHRDAVSALSFQTYTRTLFSGSHDRTVKLWNTVEMAYVDTLFGHQAEVNALQCLHGETPITGGRDATARLWKVKTGSQLVFRAPPAQISLDAIGMINGETYISGSQSGHLSLWSSQKKKPTCIVPDAHGGRWISAVAVLPSTDVIASGSSDGHIRFWKVEAKTLEEVGQAPLRGFANGLAFARSGRFLAVAQGQDHRLGKWERIADVSNGLALVKLGSDWMGKDAASAVPLAGGVSTLENDALLESDGDSGNDLAIPNTGLF